MGILYGDIGTSPLFVYSSTFRDGVGHPDDLLGALSLIIYSFLLFTIIKYVYIALRANDDGDGMSSIVDRSVPLPAASSYISPHLSFILIDLVMIASRERSDQQKSNI